MSSRGTLVALVLSAGVAATAAWWAAGSGQPGADGTAASGSSPQPQRHLPAPALASVPPPARPPAALPDLDSLQTMRQPNAERSSLIETGGVAALLDWKPPCGARQHVVARGREGLGGVGCQVTDAEGNAVRIGRWVMRIPEGMVEEGAFESDRRQGVWTRWHATGFKAAEGQYLESQPHGEWHEWDPSGRHVATRRYDRGRLHGLSVVWRGNRPEATVWENGRRTLPASSAAAEGSHPAVEGGPPASGRDPLDRLP